MKTKIYLYIRPNWCYSLFADSNKPFHEMLRNDAVYKTPFPRLHHNVVIVAQTSKYAKCQRGIELYPMKLSQKKTSYEICSTLYECAKHHME